MNNLIDFLQQHNIKIAQAARAIGVDRSYLYKLVKGQRQPGKHLERSIIQYCENVHKIAQGIRPIKGPGEYLN